MSDPYGVGRSDIADYAMVGVCRTAALDLAAPEVIGLIAEILIESASPLSVHYSVRAKPSTIRAR